MSVAGDHSPYRTSYRFRVWTQRNPKWWIVPALVVIILIAGAAGVSISAALRQPQIAMESGASQANTNIYGLAYVTVWFTLTNTGHADGVATVNLVVVHSARPVIVAQERYLVPAQESADFQLSVLWPFYLGPTSDLGVSYPDLVSVIKA